MSIFQELREFSGMTGVDTRLVGYDNERGKGDHKHIGGKELEYAFQSVDQLLEDFWRDVKRYDDG